MSSNKQNSKPSRGTKGPDRKQQLAQLLPYGLLGTKKWLLSQGLSVHAIDNAVKSATLLSLASGVFSQYTRNLTWHGVVASIQRMDSGSDSLAPSVLVGGLSALDLAGMTHYLPLSDTPHIHLYSPKPLPSWLARLEIPYTFEHHSAKRIWSSQADWDTSVIKQHSWNLDAPPVFYSCPEKAMLELLCDVPNALSFEHADELMQGMVNLSPRKLDTLLKSCKNVKAKRLFFWLAKRQGHAWFGRLSKDDYDLGSGKRLIAIGGRLDSELLITVPEHML